MRYPNKFDGEKDDFYPQLQSVELALLQITFKTMPDALRLVYSQTTRDTQELFKLGVPFGIKKLNANLQVDVNTMLTELNNRYSDKYEASKARLKFEKLQ